MIRALLLCSLLVPCFVISQTWTTVNSEPFNGPFGFVKSYTGWNPGNRQFKVNSFNGSIWFGYRNEAHGFDQNGNYFRFNDSNTPVFVALGQGTVLEFDFTQNLTYLIDAYNGVLSYDQANWMQIATGSGASDISSDEDSVWVAYAGSQYLMWKDGTPSAGNVSFFKRIVSRKGDIWGSGSYYHGSVQRLVNDSPVIYNPDTCALLDYDGYDFKFAKLTDTLYIAGAMGISLAHNGIFIDTITQGNSINMPAVGVQEIEFDQNNNIWALFGTDYDQITHLAYYDQQTEEWSNIYDNSNSPIDWSGRVSIELDSAGNVYVVDVMNLHVLQINNWPGWLGVEELTKNHKELVKVVDLMGRETEEQPNQILIYIYSDGTTEKVFKTE